MKKVIFTILIFAVLTILSCQNEKKEDQKKTETVEQPKTIEKEQKSPQFSKIISEKAEDSQKIIKDSLDITFIGKTTQELNEYNFHECFGGIIEGESEKYGISEYSLNIDDCRKGKSKLCLEKFKNYYEKGKANFEIKDELIVTSNYPKKCYSKIVQKLENSKFEKNYIIEYEDNFKPTLTKIYKLWEIDLSNEKFIPVEIPKNFKCNNPEYADGI